MYGVIKNNNLSVVEKLVGRGLQFSPMRVAGKTASNTGVDRITQSLFCLFSTRRGERLFQPEFGTRIYDYLFEPNDFIFRDMVKYYAEEDIKIWEKRIVAIVNVTLEEGTNRAKLEVIYSIKGDSNKYSYVYPLNRELNELGGGVFG